MELSLIIQMFKWGFGGVRNGGVAAGTASFSPWNVTYNSDVQKGVLMLLGV